MLRLHLILLTFILSLVACSNSFKAVTFGSASINAPLGSSELTPASDKLDSNCMTSSSYDACLFYKNPVAQQAGPLSSASRDALANLQIYGVKLTGLNGSGFLENSSIRINATRTPRLNVANLSQLKIPVTRTASSELEQLMAYYYMNRAIEYISARGPLAVRNQAINVIVDEHSNGFKIENKSIYLKRMDGQLPVAFDASQSVYLLGLANAHLASNGALNAIPLNDANHRNCGGDGKGCCATMNGCARAIASGSATYFVAMLFPDKPVVGELAGNRSAGVRLCNVSDRDLNSVSAQTATAAYQLCASRQGDANILGAVYASIWWQLRNAVPAEAYIVDHIYLQHLSRLSSNDTFTTAKAKILQVDRELNGGSLSTRITDEFARRGL